MPELPEVETIRRDLAPRLVGRTIDAITIHPGAERLAVTHPPRVFERALAGRSFDALERHGKYLIARLDNGRTWVLHLRMTGVLVMRRCETPPSRFERARVELDNGLSLRLDDMRKFATWHLVDNSREAMPRIGPDTLSGEFTAHWLRSAIARRSVPIKSALLDQRVAAGVGNIYADEALWLARIDPRTPANELSSRRVARLHASICETLAAALDDRGSSFDTYRDGFGSAGGHHMKVHVFRRDGEPCERPRCHGRRIIRARLGGRATHFCTSCQRR